MWIINGPVCFQNDKLGHTFPRWLRSLMGFYLRMSTQVRVSFYLCPNLLKIWLKFMPIILTLVSVKILTRALQLQFIWDTEINALKFKFTSSWAYQQQMPTTFQVCSGICYIHTSTRTLLLSWKVIIINHLVNRVNVNFIYQASQCGSILHSWFGFKSLPVISGLLLRSFSLRWQSCLGQVAVFGSNSGHFAVFPRLLNQFQIKRIAYQQWTTYYSEVPLFVALVLQYKLLSLFQ